MQFDFLFEFLPILKHQRRYYKSFCVHTMEVTDMRTICKQFFSCTLNDAFLLLLAI